MIQCASIEIEAAATAVVDTDITKLLVTIALAIEFVSFLPFWTASPELLMFLKNVLAICPLRLILWYPFIEFLIPRRLLSQAVTINASLIGRAFTQGNVFVDNTVRRNLISRANWDGL